MSDEYFIRMRGRIQGPFAIEKLQSMARRGLLSRFHELSLDKQNWIKASERKELFETEARQAVERKIAGPQDTSPFPNADEGATSSVQWFYGTSLGQTGPVDTPTLERLVRLGSVAPEDQVWCEGMATWALVKEVPQLASCLPLDEVAPSDGVVDRLLAMLGAKGMVAVACTALLVVTGGSGLLFFGIFSSGSSFDPDIVTSITQHGKFDDAVGKVVWGWDVILKNGKHIQLPLATGSAFTVNDQGFMITNRHVVSAFQEMQDAAVENRKREFVLYIESLSEKATDETKKEEFSKEIGQYESAIKKIKPVLCVFLHGEKYEARIKYIHPVHDLAILDTDHRIQTRFRLSGAAPDRLTDAEVRAIGFPAIGSVDFSQAELMTRISRKQELLFAGDLATFFDGRDKQFYMTAGRISQVTRDQASDLMWLQHTADLNGGNSGGPLVGTDALVLGVNTQKAAGTINRSFSLHQDELRKEIDEHVKGVTWVD